MICWSGEIVVVDNVCKVWIFTITNVAISTNSNFGPLPNRAILSPGDHIQFQRSPLFSSLLNFVKLVGEDLKTNYAKSTNSCDDSLFPAVSLLSTFLKDEVASQWVIDIPPMSSGKVRRFGDPSFKSWVTKMEGASPSIVQKIIDASSTVNSSAKTTVDNTSHVNELATFLTSSFGHPIRLDYGTGHESSFIVFLFSLFKLGLLPPPNLPYNTSNSSSSTSDEMPLPMPPSSSSSSSSPATKSISLGPAVLKIFSAYLYGTRSIQTEYNLEPAGSHGVWGLDDYHCLSFYFGACQIVGYIGNNSENFDDKYLSPGVVLKEDITGFVDIPKGKSGEEGGAGHNDTVEEKLMYIASTNYIKRLKFTAPFPETSPMLTSIAKLPEWKKVASGLMKLYEGEVLMKFVVVQHFVFGEIFKCSWVPVQQDQRGGVISMTGKQIPGGKERSVFVNREECVAPVRVGRVEGGGEGKDETPAARLRRNLAKSGIKDDGKKARAGGDSREGTTAEVNTAAVSKGPDMAFEATKAPWAK